MTRTRQTHLYILVLAATIAISIAQPLLRREAHAQQITATLQGDPSHPATTQNWVDTRLYFGLGPADLPDKGISSTTWRDFLDGEVTPRFPSGLSVIDVYGQWQSSARRASNSTPSRVRTKLLIIDYPDTPANRASIEAIRIAWKKLTGDQSVLKVTQPADISF
jgi:hypothetical protein